MNDIEKLKALRASLKQRPEANKFYEPKRFDGKLPVKFFSARDYKVLVDRAALNGNVSKSDIEFYVDFLQLFYNGTTRGQFRALNNTDLQKEMKADANKRHRDCVIGATVGTDHKTVWPDQITGYQHVGGGDAMWLNGFDNYSSSRHAFDFDGADLDDKMFLLGQRAAEKHVMEDTEFKIIWDGWPADYAILQAARRILRLRRLQKKAHQASHAAKASLKKQKGE